MLPLPATRARTGAMSASFVIETAALRMDGTRLIAQHKVPVLPLFENASSAFGRGTVIEADVGPVAIEDILPGDWLRTSQGDAAQVTWVGASSFVPADAGCPMPLVRIMADSFGMNRPGSYLTLGPAARVLQTPHRLAGSAAGQRLLTPAREFVDGVNVIEVVPPTPVRLFHICLTRHAAIIADGLEVETLHPGTSALRAVPHHIRDLYLSMFPRIAHAADFGPLAHPRAPEMADVDAA